MIVSMEDDPNPDETPASRASGNVVWLLEEAGWRVTSIEYDSALNVGFFDGVVIEA